MSSEQAPGRAWVFGDDVNTDLLAPGAYMKGPFETLASHCLEAVDPMFAQQVQAGDMIVAGENFGIGSSREQAAQALKHLGVSAVLARSFGGIFFRNALNLGLVALTCPDSGRIRAGDRLAVDAAVGAVDNLSTGERYPCNRLPPKLLDMVRDGGLVAYLEKRQSNGEPDQDER